MPIQIIFQRKLRFIIDINFISQLLGGSIFSDLASMIKNYSKYWKCSDFLILSLKTLPDDCDQSMKQILATHVGNYTCVNIYNFHDKTFPFILI